MKIPVEDYVASLEKELAETSCADDLMRVGIGARIHFLRGLSPDTTLDAGELQRELQAVRGEIDIFRIYLYEVSKWGDLNLYGQGRQARRGKRGPGSYTPKPSF